MPSKAKKDMIISPAMIKPRRSKIPDSEIPVLFDVLLVVTHKNGEPCIEMRRSSTDNAVIRQICLAILQDHAIVVRPCVRNKQMFINSLLQKGILYRDENGKFDFL